MNENLRINATRMRADFEALAQIGATGDGGVHRPAFSEAHLAARAWFREQIHKAGLETRVDGAGNHSAFLKCAVPLPYASSVLDKGGDTKTLLLGSHLDSVPYGGRFDGALGVISALEVLRTVKEAGASLSMNLEAIDFTDEEGTLIGLTGSSALAGKLKAEDLQKPRGGRERLVEGMMRAGLTDESMLSAARPAASLGGYLEVHIEQGRRLEKARTNIGIVSSIVGIASLRLVFIGRADHAGTTPMRDRLDAGAGASAFALAVREIVMNDFPDCVVNVGNMVFTPGAFNIVPARVEVSFESRAPTFNEFYQLRKAIFERLEKDAGWHKLLVDIKPGGEHLPTPMSVQAKSACTEACDALGLTHMPLVSYAGHDAQSLADLCPVGMIFVPSVAGASHSPRELTQWEDCVNGANVLLQAALRLAM